MKNETQAALLMILRREFGMTQAEMGKALSLSARTIRRWEAGDTKAHRVYLRRIQQLVEERRAGAKEGEEVAHG